ILNVGRPLVGALLQCNKSGSMLHRTNPANPAGPMQETAMYQFNDFTKATSQFADVAANANRLALENAEKAFGLQLAAVEENVNAAFAYFGELIEVRDAEGLKAVLPKGAQVARANAERSFG